MVARRAPAAGPDRHQAQPTLRALVRKGPIVPIREVRGCRCGFTSRPESPAETPFDRAITAPRTGTAAPRQGRPSGACPEVETAAGVSPPATPTSPDGGVP